jgi:hypothetical protein
MKEIRTTFYELRSYFVPGSIVLWAILELLCLTGYEPTTRAVSAFSMSIKGVLFIIIAYVLGHALHVVANSTIDKLPFGSYPPKNYFKVKFEKDFSPEAINSLHKAVTTLMGSPNTSVSNANDTIQKAYWICFQYVMNVQNVETENFLGLTGFYRGITSAMMVISGMYVVSFILHGKVELVVIGVVATFFACLFLTRVHRFSYYLVRTVYSNFLNSYNEKQSSSSM